MVSLEQSLTLSAADFARLRDWMDARGLGSGPIAKPALLAGGTQNVLLRFERGAEVFVLRRPSLTPREGANELLLREARVLSALDRSAVPHPRLIAVCVDQRICGAAFYLMEAVDGFNPVGTLPSSHRNGLTQRAMGLALVDAIAALGSVDYEAVGLTDFGHPDGFLERQVPRWTKELDSYGAIPMWPGRKALPDLLPMSAWLGRHRPAHFTPGIMHGDFHVGNVMFCHDGPQIAALIDWELSTIGDPMLDLGWLLATWPQTDGRSLSPTLDVRPWNGFPNTNELKVHYGLKSKRDLSAIDWYVALACYKLGIILEGTYARALAGIANPATGRTLHEVAIRLFERGLSIVR